MIPEHLETERLELERLDESMATRELYDICSGTEMEDVTEYLSWDPHTTPKETAAFLADVREDWESDEAAHYALRPKPGEAGAGAFAGIGSLAVDWDRRVGSLGCWLRKPFWGRGYSGERAVALAELAFETLDLALVEVTHLPANENSERAITKYVEALGGRREGLLRGFHGFESEPVDAVRYTVTREEYEEVGEAE